MQLIQCIKPKAKVHVIPNSLDEEKTKFGIFKTTTTQIIRSCLQKLLLYFHVKKIT